MDFVITFAVFKLLFSSYPMMLSPGKVQGDVMDSVSIWCEEKITQASTKEAHKRKYMQPGKCIITEKTI